VKIDFKQVNSNLTKTPITRRCEGQSIPKITKNLNFTGLEKILNSKTIVRVSDTFTKALDGRFPKMLSEFDELTKGLNFSQTITQSRITQKASNGLGQNVIEFSQRNILGKIVDNFTYFLKGLWLDTANAGLGALKKVKGLKNSNFLNKLYNSKILTNQRKNKEATNLFYSIVGMAKKGAELDIGLRQITSDVKVANYNTSLADFIGDNLKKPMGAYSAKSERALNRLATGAVSATFVGKDFYNLTMYQTNNKEEAKKSERKRFKQEITRIATSAFISFSVLGIFSKWTNKSMLAAAGVSAGATLFSEVFSRLKNGTPLTPLTPNQAKKIHDERQFKGKNKKDNKSNNIANNNNYSNVYLPNEIKTVDDYIQSLKTGAKIPFFMANKNISFENNQNNSQIKNQTNTNVQNPITNKQNNEAQNKNNKSILVKAGKILGGLLLFGFAWDKAIKHIVEPFIKDYGDKININKLKKIGNKLTKKDIIVTPSKMEATLKAVKESGYGELEKTFRSNLNSFRQGKYYILGQKDTILGMFLAMPKKIIDLAKAPYSALCNLIKYKPAWHKENPKSEIGEIKNALSVLCREVTGKNLSEKEAGKLVQKRIDSLFNDETMIKYKQSSFAMTSRTLVTLIASYFFVNDFRNQVLIDSAGKDVKRAKEVTNERIGHKLTNFVTNAFWMNLFNTTFANSIMKSLFAATLVPAVTEVCNETSIRYSIGVPQKRMESKEDIQKFEEKNYNNKGLYGKWIRLVSKATGKKPISKKAKSSKK